MADYSELAIKAREQVRNLEEPYRSIAYETILRELIAESKRTPQRPPSHASQPTGHAEDPVSKFLESPINPERYAKVFALKGKLLEKSLAVLRIARDDLAIDGLTAPQIAEILVKKFRVARVHGGNVSRDLGTANQYVHRVKAGDGYMYMLMKSGETRLDELLAELEKTNLNANTRQGA